MPVVTLAVAATVAAVSGGTLAAGSAAALTIGAITAAGVYTGVASVGMSMINQRKEEKALRGAANDATARAKQIEEEAAKAGVLAEEKSREDARKRLAAVTQTIYTSPLGLTDTTSNIARPTLLGS